MHISPLFLSTIEALYSDLLGDEPLMIYPLGTGLINDTWISNSRAKSKRYVIQRLNTVVFPSYSAIENNLKKAKEILSNQNYLLFLPIENSHGELHSRIDGDLYRVTEFCEGSQTYDSPPSTDHIRGAARAFALLTAALSQGNIETFESTIEGFHDLVKRYEDFQLARQACSDVGRIEQAAGCLEFAQNFSWVVDLYVRSRTDIPQRIYHHDTKVNNILFRQGTAQVIAPIDLDTLMPGYIFSDVGDMIWSIAAGVDHANLDRDHIAINRERYTAIMEGYADGMKDIITDRERELLPYAGLIMSYMLGLRFLADYLSGDIYFKVASSRENLERCEAQFRVVKLLVDEGFVPIC